MWTNIASQFQNGMHLPLMMGSMQESQALSWLPNNENQHMMLTGEPNFLLPRCGLVPMTILV